VKALETIQFSLMSHRGCYGECNFCSITVHYGRTIRSRSERSIVEEAKKMIKHPDFKGYISDVGGATANMFGNHCEIQETTGSCKKKRCSFPSLCDNMHQSHKRQIELLKRLRALPNVKKVFVGSGVRHDLVLQDKTFGHAYLENIVRHHVSGQMKIAPEHTEDKVLNAMGKPGKESLIKFKKDFDDLNKKAGLKQFLTYYFIAAHPGCSILDTEKMQEFIKRELKLNPEQVQIFTPTPSTYSTMMYHTGVNPMDKKEIFVEKDPNRKEKQKELIVGKPKFNKYQGKRPAKKRAEDFDIQKNRVTEKNKRR
nr:DUF3362 domain-containing protein [Candidatus Kapabacteria bacterium]